MLRHVSTQLLLVSLALSGCALTPPPIKNPRDQSLILINNYYRQTVAEAKRHPSQQWHHGRLGNMIVNLAGEPHSGLCYHWQKIVNQGIKPGLKITGWKAAGIASNEGTRREHHAVLVYNPETHDLQNLLSHHKNQSVYVLDPWPTGTAAIYSLTQWLQWTTHVQSSVRLTLIKENKEIGTDGC